jgi:glycosyltransferase involved in cell wall biosynthesis
LKSVGSEMVAEGDAPLKILHVVRAPVGGIFRHILDLTEGQIAQGHQVGFVLDSTTGGARAEAALAAIGPKLSLGVNRYPIARELSLSDVRALALVSRRIKEIRPDVLHGHGAKGGAFLRLCPTAAGAIRVYTPHGGSLHYPKGTPRGNIYSALERILMGRTNLFLFESRFARDTYYRAVGNPRNLVRVVPNGVTDAEFVPVVPAADATDIVYVGEFRRIKGADVLVDAIAELHRSGRKISATLAGDGDDNDALRAQVQRLGLGDHVRFVGHIPARDAFAMGRLLVVPSRADSLPYVVLEAAAAGVPMIASRVGGIPEVLGAESEALVRAESPAALVEAMAATLDNPAAARARADSVRERVRGRFSQGAMVAGVLAAYREALSQRK